MENLSMNKKIGLGAGLVMLISCFLTFIGGTIDAGPFGSIDWSYTMWDIANGVKEDGVEILKGDALSYLYLVLAAGALFFTWTDNFKFARIAFAAVLVLFLIQYFTGVNPEDATKDNPSTAINSEIFDHAKIGLWLLLGSAAAGGFFSKE